MAIFSPPRARVARGAAVGASALLIAGMLGACANAPQNTANATVPGPAPSSGPVAAEEHGALVGSLKNAEVAVKDYARAYRQETNSRDAAQSAGIAALVAQHRQFAGAQDFVLVPDAEQKAAQARQELKVSEAATRSARLKLYQAFGFDRFSRFAEQSGSGAAIPVRGPLDAPRFKPDQTL